MRMEIIISLKKKWHNYDHTYVRGSAFSDGKLLKGIELAKYINNSKEVDKRSVVERLNGFFAVVQKTDQHAFVGVDRIRSIPLFYSRHGEKLLISDDPYWIKQQTGDNEFDELSKRELLLTGYVTGSDTLCENVKQLRAAEVLQIGTKITSNRYYSFRHSNNDFQGSIRSLLKKHDQILIESFKRLITYANGRTIVVPLSGGYDSRLVVLMLKRLNYKDIVTFTYGRIDNREYKVSKQVAQKLNLKWLFIPYTNSCTYEWYNSEDRKAYGKMADNLCSILLDREFPAVWKLKRNDMIPDDSIFVPGHTADFVSGGHIPCNWYDRVSERQFVEQIVRKHYVMWNWQNESRDFKEQIYNKIITCSEINRFSLHSDPASIYERWDWQERQTKYIVNSVRIYEFWYYDWWLPFWDTEYVQYWNRVPLKWRINKKLYEEYVIGHYSQITGLALKEARIRDTNLGKRAMLSCRLKKLVRQVPIGYFLEAFLDKCVKKTGPGKHEYDTDWEQSYGRMRRELYDKLSPYIVGRSSCATLERLGYISYTDSDVSEEVMTLLESMKGTL
jgi:asparagine synthase (glutamine-hydrolysing)